MSAKRAAKVVISLGWRALQHVARATRKPPPPSLTILLYHAVRPDDLAAFRWQLDAVARYADVVDPDCVTNGGARPKIAITFDDAFRSTIDNALPELSVRGMRATVFAPTGCLDGPPPWLAGSTFQDRDERIVDAAALQALAQAGVKVGSHSRTHPQLTRLSPPEAEVEIVRSKQELEELLGAPVALFAFPYGVYNARLLKICARAGYRFAYSVEPGTIEPANDTLLRPRVVVEPTDWKIEFWLKIRGGYDWMPLASRLKRRLLGRRYVAAHVTQ